MERSRGSTGRHVSERDERGQLFFELFDCKIDQTLAISDPLERYGRLAALRDELVLYRGGVSSESQRQTMVEATINQLNEELSRLFASIWKAFQNKY